MKINRYKITQSQVSVYKPYFSLVKIWLLTEIFFFSVSYKIHISFILVENIIEKMDLSIILNYVSKLGIFLFLVCHKK